MFVSQCWFKSVTNSELVEDSHKPENGGWIDSDGGIYVVPLKFHLIVATASAGACGISED